MLEGKIPPELINNKKGIYETKIEMAQININKIEMVHEIDSIHNIDVGRTLKILSSWSSPLEDIFKLNYDAFLNNYDWAALEMV